MRLLLAITFLITVFTSSALADLPPKLYKDFYYGMPIDEVSKISGASPCQDEELQGSLCIDSVTFGGLEWEQVFLMNEDKLVSVILANEDDEDKFITLTNVLKNSGYFMAMGINGNDTFDTITLLLQGEGVFTSKIIEFFSQSYEFMTCIYLERNMFKEVKSRIKNINNIGELFMNAPLNAREIDINRNNDIMSVHFTVPIFAKYVNHKKIKELKEDF